MHRGVLRMLAALAAVSCGSGRPPFDSPREDPPVTDGGGDFDARHDADAGIRLLSDVIAPREIDGRAGGAGRDARSDAARDSPTDMALDTEREATIADADASADHRASDADANVHDRETSDERGALADANTDIALADVEVDADANEPFDACESGCQPESNHLLITEIVTRPRGAEMIEIANFTARGVDLSDYVLSDSHLYYQIATGSFTTASGSDFAARFPDGSIVLPGRYVVVALENASGGSASFEATYGKKPDFELRPSANGATDDAAVPNMQSAQLGASIGATASLTDAGEPVILFFYRGGALVSDVDYVFFGAPTASNLVVDKTGVVVSGARYADDTAASSQRHAPAPSEGGSLHRCIDAELDETFAGGNGLTGHDETSEDATKAFALATAPTDRTPGGPPPKGLCGP